MTFIRALMAALILALCLGSGAHAQTPDQSAGGMAASLFPTPTTLHFYAKIDNATFDCVSSFVCAGPGSPIDTLFHSDNADNFHRQAGWGEVAVHWFPGKHQHTAYQFLVSKYDTAEATIVGLGPNPALDPAATESYAEWSYQDFGSMMPSLSFLPYATAATYSALPEGLTGGTAVYEQHNAKTFAIAVVAYTADGTVLEAVAFGKNLGHREASTWKAFAKQLPAAIALTP